MPFETVATIVNDAAVELGLGSVSNAFASTDPNVVQLRTILTGAGRALVKRFPWTNSIQEYTFTTAGSASYVLPDDFRGLVPGAHWDRSDVLPMVGPIASQGWQALKASNTSAVLGVFFRVWRSALYVFPSTDAGTRCAIEYYSWFWVQPDGETDATADRVSANSDTLCLDPDLIRCALKLRFLRAKGFATSAAEAEFAEALTGAMNDDAPAPTLRMDDGPLETKLINASNAPVTGFGFGGDGGLF